MTAITEQSVRQALESIVDPLLGQSYIDLDAVSSLGIVDNQVHLKIKTGYQAESLYRKFGLAITSRLEMAGFANPVVEVVGEVLACPERNTHGRLSDVKNIITVASGKGGVGKSTTAVNLALALQAEGATVGLLDADIYGPSQRLMLGVDDGVKPELVDEKYVQPITRMGIKSMSAGYLSEEKAPMIWRGPMATRALQQLMEQTIWGELDYLVIDMPPGTGDIQISLAQKTAVSGAVIVTTPQEAALIDARKGIEMFKKVRIPVLGVVENMATHICSNCGHKEPIFGTGGARQLADEYGITILGSMPLDSRIQADADAGLPTVMADPTGPLAAAYISVGNQVAAQLWQRNLTSVAAPEIIMTEA